MAVTNYDEMDFFEKTGYVFGLIKPSWEAFKLNWATFILLWLLPAMMVLLLTPLLILPFISDGTVWTASASFLALLGIFIAIFIFILLWPAMIITQLESVKGNKINVDIALKESKSVIISIVLAAIMIFFISIAPMFIVVPLMLILVGFLLLPFAIIWSMVVAFFLSLTPYLIVTEKLKPTEALNKSYNLVKKHWHWVLAVFVVLLTINLAVNVLSFVPVLGAIVGVGLSVAYLCMPAYVFVHHIQNQQPVVKKASASPSKIATNNNSAKKSAKKVTKKS